jgi:hypothetical protein
MESLVAMTVLSANTVARITAALTDDARLGGPLLARVSRGQKGQRAVYRVLLPQLHASERLNAAQQKGSAPQQREAEPAVQHTNSTVSAHQEGAVSTTAVVVPLGSTYSRKSTSSADDPATIATAAVASIDNANNPNGLCKHETPGGLGRTSAGTLMCAHCRYEAMVATRA